MGTRFPVRLATMLALVVSAGLLPPADAELPGIGAHENNGRELDVRGYWLPRHRALLRARGVLREPVAELVPAPLDPRAARFTNPVRVSSDLLAPPPAALLTAQAETQTEPYLSVDPADASHLIAGWQETRFRDGGARSLGYAVSTDGGKQWSEGLIPGLTVADGGSWERASDPWPVFGPDNRAYYASLLFNQSNAVNAIAVSVSDDGGVTWGAPVEVFRSNTDFNDKQAMVVDNFPASPHFGNVYVGWDINITRGFTTVAQRLVVARSTNGGRTYRRPARVTQSSTNIGAIPRVGPDGTVYVIWAGASAANPNLSILFSRSTNGGRSWRRPTKIANFLATGVPGYRSGAILPSFAIDPDSGDLYVAWPDARFSGVDQAALSISRDGGSSWSIPARVNDGPGTSPAMTISVATNDVGAVAVGYYTLRRNPSSNTHVDYYVNISSDGARTFGRSSRVTRKSFDATFAARAGNAQAFFLGDYEGLAGGGDRFYALWVGTDQASELGSGKQPDVFAARTR